MSLGEKIKGLLNHHGSGIAFCGKIAAKTLLPVGDEQLADCLYALFEYAKDKGDDFGAEEVEVTLSQLGAEQEHLVRLVGELDGRLSETLGQMTQMANFLPEEGLQKLLETSLETRSELTGLREEWAGIVVELTSVKAQTEELLRQQRL